MASTNTSVVFFGPKGCGKTSLVASLCQQFGGFPAEQVDDCRSLAKDLGQPAYKFAWMLDKTREERECGHTMVPSVANFRSSSLGYTVVDTPGDEGLSRTLVSALSLADVAALVVPATQGEYEQSIETGRTRELALAAFTMGIKNVIVCVSKLDDIGIEDPSARFEEVKKAVSGFLKEVGFKQKDIPFMPVSGLSGDNLVSQSAELAWSKTKSVIEVLDALGAMPRPAEKPLRLPVLKVICHEEAGTVVMGRVETGTVKVGSKLSFCPSGYTAEVKSMQKNGEKASEATGGEIVSIAFGDQIPAEDLHRGMVASSPSADPAADAETFLAQVVILDHPGKIRNGYCPSLAAHTAQVPCELEELLSLIDRKTGKDAKTFPTEARSGEVVTVRMRPRQGVCLETFGAYPALGRFALRDHGRTVAVGVVKEVTKRAVAKGRTSDDS